METGARPAPRAFGALVISLDLELIWGVRDRYPADGGNYRANLLGVWQAVPAMLDLFEEFEVAATWAVVGLLFATSPADLQAFLPAVRPAYRRTELSPYREPITGRPGDEALYFAPDLLDAIQRRPRQEIGTHTFSHYYCLEEGQDRDAFRADLASARALAARRGVVLRSLVFPRNQFNPAYTDLLIEAGITCYRGNETARMYRPLPAGGARRKLLRVGRLFDRYLSLSGTNVTPWEAVPQQGGLCNVPASRFLAPYAPRLRFLDRLRLRRLARGIEAAALSHGVYHIWWHPHNFGAHLPENLRLLRRLLEGFARCRERYGMRSLTMAEAAEVASASSDRSPDLLPSTVVAER
jgi:peptidoglycan/xylan/chitin deacetylase (PgdA/CDA1 family)